MGLEGGYASLADLRKRASRDDDWLYVDNGNRDMDWSAHDNTEVFRWVLRNRGLSVTGPAAANTLIDDVPAQTLRDEVAVDAQVRQGAVEEDPWIFGNAWGQPHVVLAWCRMLYTATLGEVTGKNDAARWSIDRLPHEWHPLIDRAISCGLLLSRCTRFDRADAARDAPLPDLPLNSRSTRSSPLSGSSPSSASSCQRTTTRARTPA